MREPGNGAGSVVSAGGHADKLIKVEVRLSESLLPIGWTNWESASVNGSLKAAGPGNKHIGCYSTADLSVKSTLSYKSRECACNRVHIDICRMATYSAIHLRNTFPL